MVADLIVTSLSVLLLPYILLIFLEFEINNRFFEQQRNYYLKILPKNNELVSLRGEVLSYLFLGMNIEDRLSIKSITIYIFCDKGTKSFRTTQAFSEESEISLGLFNKKETSELTSLSLEVD